MKINILGAEYDFEMIKHDDDSRLRQNDGFCDSTDKTIRIAIDFYEDDPGSIKNFDIYKKEIKRHEIVHSFFAECGLTEWQKNENLVDWIAIQFPKMLEVFKEVDAL